MTHLRFGFQLSLRPYLGLVVASILVGVVQGALADQTKVYEWRDANGTLSYSQQQPAPGTQGGITCREIDTKTLRRRNRSRSQRISLAPTPLKRPTRSVFAAGSMLRIER